MPTLPRELLLARVRQLAHPRKPIRVQPGRGKPGARPGNQNARKKPK